MFIFINNIVRTALVSLDILSVRCIKSVEVTCISVKILNNRMLYFLIGCSEIRLIQVLSAYMQRQRNPVKVTLPMSANVFCQNTVYYSKYQLPIESRGGCTRLPDALLRWQKISAVRYTHTVTVCYSEMTTVTSLFVVSIIPHHVCLLPQLC